MTSRETNDTILRKLLKKPSALVAVSIILLTALVALFAYLLAPDNTPHANRMIIELGAREPGFSKQLLLVPKTIVQPRGNKGMEWLSGTPSGYNAVPLNDYYFSGNKLFIKHYIDEGLEDTMTFTLQQLLPADKRTKNLYEQHYYLETHQIVTRTFYLG